MFSKSELDCSSSVHRLSVTKKNSYARLHFVSAHPILTLRLYAVCASQYEKLACKRARMHPGGRDKAPYVHTGPHIREGQGVLAYKSSH